MATQSVTKAFIDQMYESARVQGDATKACVRLVLSSKPNWSEAGRAKLEPIALAFKLGRVAGILGIDRANAEQVLSKQKPTDKKGGNSDKRRTLEEHRAYRAAVSGWEYITMLCGKPSKAKPKGAKAPVAKPATVEHPTHSVPIMSDAIGLPTAATSNDVVAFALRMADLIKGFEDRNAKVMSVEVWPIFEEFRARVAKLAAPAAPESKPVPKSKPVTNHGTSVPVDVQTALGMAVRKGKAHRRALARIAAERRAEATN